MAVPAHDERDREFAEAFDLPIVEVVTEDGVLVILKERRPARRRGKAAIVERLRANGKGEPAVSYRLRDWSFSRQRYWGCPIPIVYCDDDGLVPVPDDELPVLLPEVEDYRPKGVPPLASNEEWLNALSALRESPARGGRHDGHVRRLLLVLPALRRSALGLAPFDRRAVDYWAPSTSTSAASTTPPGTSCTRASS